MGPFLGTQKIRCRIIIGTQKGTIILTTTHMVYTCSLVGILRLRLGPDYRCRLETPPEFGLKTGENIGERVL